MNLFFANFIFLSIIIRTYYALDNVYDSASYSNRIINPNKIDFNNICTCDLIPNSCDAYCCCDSDCNKVNI